jgi:hypothetical protein
VLPQLAIVILCVVILFALIGYLIAQEAIEMDQIKVYSLTFPQRSTVFNLDNGKLALTVHNDPAYPILLNVYGLNSYSNTAAIFASDFVDEFGDILDSEKVLFNNSRQLTLDSNSNDPQKIAITMMDNKKAGSFQGWFILLIGTDTTTSIPISFSTPPMISAALLWIVVGILTSIVFWEIIKYLNNVIRIQIGNGLNYEPTAQANITLKVQAYNKRLSGRKGKARVAIINFATALFGLSVAFITLIITNAAWTNLLTIDIYDKLVLIGLGLGVQSAKELVDKT